MQLRHYQHKIINVTAKKVYRDKKVIMQAPTGAGKTFIFGNIIKRHLAQNAFNRVLVLTHRTELFDQTKKAIDTVAGIESTPLIAGMKTNEEHKYSRCLIAMIETMKRRSFDLFGDFTLCIVDEAHRNDFRDIIDKLPPHTLLIGATATPISASKKHPLKDIYNNIVFETSINQLIQEGYLAKPLHYKATFDETGLKKRGGEFTAQTQMEKFEGKIYYDNVVDLWRKYANGKKTIVFNVNKEHTRLMNEKFLSAGITSTELLSGDPKRAEKLAQFKSGEIMVLNNCEIATTGFDEPSIECVIMNRATASLPLWLQSVGRGSRTTPTKNEFIILDFGGNIDRHGLWNTERDWKSIFFNPKEAYERPAPMRECPECGGLVFAGVSHCGECGFIFPTPKQEEAQRVQGFLEKVGHEGVIGKFVGDLNVHELIALEDSGRYKPSFIWRILRSRGAHALAEYAKIKGYKKGWVQHQIGLPSVFNNYRVNI